MEHRQDRDCDESEGDHTIGINEAVATGFERLRRVTVAGQHRTQKREAVECGVRGQQENQSGGCLNDKEHDASIAKGRPRHLRHETRLGRGLAVSESNQVTRVFGVVHSGDNCQRNESREQADRNGPEHKQCGAGVVNLRLTECGNAVRDGLDSREGRASAGKGPKQQEDERRLSNVVPFHGVLRRVGYGGVAQESANERRHNHEHNTADEEVRGNGKRQTGFAHATEVHNRQNDDERDGELHPPRVEKWQCRDDVVDTRGNRHGDRHHIVNEQRTCHNDAGPFANVLARHLVVAATRRVRLDELSIARDDDNHEQDDRGRNPRGESQEA